MKLKHLEHIEDYPIIAGEKGFEYARNTLNAVYKYLLGETRNVLVTTKYDGSPSIVFGHHPENGKFFVGTKSVFNVKPKINYTVNDIQNNHSLSPGLATTLAAALVYLPLITPKKGVFQGDVMFTVYSLREGSDVISFTPNTITYSVPTDSKFGKAIAKAKIGIVVHTTYFGKTLESMKANFDVPLHKFTYNSDVFLINPEIDSVINFSKFNRDSFEYYMSYVDWYGKNFGKKEFDRITEQSEQIQKYIHSCVRLEEKPQIKGYKTYLSREHVKKMCELKSERGQRNQLAKHDAELDYIDLHERDFDQIFMIHHFFQSAKNHLVDTLGSSSQFTHMINNELARPEGFVATYDGIPSKLVNRQEFTKSNFERWKK